MSDTPNNTRIPNGDWVDLYAVTGIARGSKLIVQNTGWSRVLLQTALIKPAVNSTDYEVIDPNQQMVNDGDDYAEWARSSGDEGLLNIRVFKS